LINSLNYFFQAKVVSIVGNTGEGKSYCLNRLFFGDFDDDEADDGTREGVFSTSSSQDSCTLGVWTAFDPTREVIVLDTEGMLGQTGN
jgi:zinc finger FYVE domain-containing protein 1